MAAERNSFQSILERTAQESPAPVPEAAPVAKPRRARTPQATMQAAAIPASERRGASTAYRPSREGRRLVAGHFDPKVVKQLKLLAVEEDKSQQELLEEALDDLFVKKGKYAIVRAGG